MAKWSVDKTDGETGKRSQCGGPSKTGDKARQKVADYRKNQERGSSNQFHVRKGK